MNLSKFIKNFGATLLVLPLLAGCTDKPSGNQSVVDKVSKIGAIATKDNGQILDTEVSNHIKASESLYVAYSVDQKVGEETVQVSIEYSMDDKSKDCWQSKKKNYTHMVFSVKDGANDYNPFESVLTAKITYEDAEKVLMYKISVGEGKRPVVCAMSDLYSKGFEDGDAVVVAGYVTGAFADYTSGLYLQSGDSAVMLFGKNLSDVIPSVPAVGTLMEVCGFYSPYNGLVELKDLKYAKVCASVDDLSAEMKAVGVEKPVPYDITNPKEQWTVENLKSKQSVQINFNNLEVVKFQDKTGNPIKSNDEKYKDTDPKEIPDAETLAGYKLTDHWKIMCKASDGTSVVIYMNYHAGDAVRDPIKNILKVGELCDVKGAVLSWYNGPQITPIASNQIVLSSVD